MIVDHLIAYGDELEDGEDENLEDDEDYFEDSHFYEDDEDEDDGMVACRICSCLIGDEVGYGDDWGEGPFCENCAGTAEGAEE
jgi:hypothetical protein